MALLEDLRAHTAIDTIELSNFTLDWDATQDDLTAAAPALLALPETEKFGGLPVPLATAEEYEVLALGIERISTQGFKVACNITPFYMSDPQAQSFSCVDVTGRRVPGLRPSLGVYGCPNRPEVAAYGEAMARAFVTAWPAIDILTINHAEYLFWPQTHAEEVFSCFCSECRKRANAIGLDLERVAHDLQSLIRRMRECGSRASLQTLPVDDEMLTRWLAFRRDAVSECVMRIAAAARQEAAARGIELSVGLEAQLPTLAPIVGTDIGRLAERCDFIVVKFSDYVPATVLPWLAGAVSGSRTGSLLGELRERLGLGVGPTTYRPAADFAEGLIYANAFDPEVFDRQIPLLADLRGRVPVLAYLWKYGDDDASLAHKIRAVEERGFDGYFLWVWNRDLQSSALGRWPAGPAEALGAT